MIKISNWEPWGNGQGLPCLVKDLPRSGVSRPAIKGSRLLPVDWATAGKNLLAVPTILVASVSYGSSPDVLKKEAIGLKGKVKRLIRLRGVGFISAENGEEVFFHRSVLRGEDFDALQEVTSAEFEFTRGSKGPRAVRVVVAK
jgi:CspA family cold shock protein